MTLEACARGRGRGLRVDSGERSRLKQSGAARSAEERRQRARQVLKGRAGPVWGLPEGCELGVHSAAARRLAVSGLTPRRASQTGPGGNGCWRPLPHAPPRRARGMGVLGAGLGVGALMEPADLRQRRGSDEAERGGPKWPKCPCSAHWPHPDLPLSFCQQLAYEGLLDSKRRQVPPHLSEGYAPPLPSQASLTPRLRVECQLRRCVG